MEPGSSLELDLLFRPLEEKQYEFQIPIEIDKRVSVVHLQSLGYKKDVRFFDRRYLIIHRLNSRKYLWVATKLIVKF